METWQLDVDGKTLFVRSFGDGLPVVLLHGFGEDGQVWTDLAETIKGCRLLVPDLPGSGLSAAVADMSMEGIARTLQQALQQLAITHCTLIGHSMGGYIALAFLEAFPQQVMALGLFHATTYADSEDKKATRRKGIAFINTHGAGRFLETTTPNMFAPVTQQEQPELIRRHLETVRHADDAAMVAYYEAMMQRPDRTFLLRQNKIPWLFVVGRHDNAVPVADSLQQVHIPLMSYVYLLERSGHMGMLEEPEQSRNLLQTFLDTVTQ